MWSSWVSVAVTAAVVEAWMNPQQGVIEGDGGKHFIIGELLNPTMVPEDEPHP
jgi:hypothetical protein